MLDGLRYMVCWMPIILTIMHFAFKTLGLEDEAGPVDELEEAMGNASLSDTLLAASNQTNSTGLPGNLTIS